jgi:hypothetical protein
MMSRASVCRKGVLGSLSCSPFHESFMQLPPSLQVTLAAWGQVWAPGSRIFPQEPTFVPRPHATAEDDGWVVCTVFDGETQKTDVVILDAQRLAAGPVATIHLPHHIPPGANPSEREIERLDLVGSLGSLGNPKRRRLEIASECPAAGMSPPNCWSAGPPHHG